MRKLTAPKIVIATHNPGKLPEITALLEPFGILVVSASELGLQEPAETEDNFAGNARIKAHFAARETGLPALSDDSGIEVAALGGAPGVYTADWAQTPSGRNFDIAMARVWQELEDHNAPEPRTAQFVCALCLAWPDGHDEIFRGKARGRIVWPKRGSNGFGFDPVFMPDSETRTFGEMAPAEKHAMSHRTAAFRKFVPGCLGE